MNVGVDLGIYLTDTLGEGRDDFFGPGLAGKKNGLLQSGGDFGHGAYS